PDARVVQRANRADMCPPARGAAAEHETDPFVMTPLPHPLTLSFFPYAWFDPLHAGCRPHATRLMRTWLVPAYHVRARRRVDDVIRIEVHIEESLCGDAALAPLPAPHGLGLEPVDGYFAGLAEQAPHFVLGHAGPDLREVRRGEHLRHRRQP